MLGELTLGLERAGELLCGGELALVPGRLGVLGQAGSVLDRLQEVLGLRERRRGGLEGGLARGERLGALCRRRLARLALSRKLQGCERDVNHLCT